MPAEPRLPPSARLLRPANGLAAVAGLVALVCLGAVTGTLTGTFSWLVAVPAFLAYSAALLVAGRATTDPRWFRRDPRPLSITEGAVHAGGERLLDRAAITQAFVLAQPHGGALVQLRGPRRRVTVACDDEAAAHDLLGRLELDTSRSTAVYRVASQILLSAEQRTPTLAALGAIWAAAVATTLSAGAGGIWTVALLASAALLVAAGLLLLWPTRILVGADAVVIRWMGRERRLRLDEIDHVVRSPGVLRLLLRSDEVIELAYPGEALTDEALARMAAEGHASGPAELGRAGARIEEALAAYAHPRDAETALALERGSRRTAEWLRHLRSVGGSARAEQSDYRRPALPPERLWRIVEDPASPPGARAGAAVALSRGLDDPGKKRLRIAAEATALPGMRVLLESAADEAADEAALCELLDQVDEGDEARTR